MNKIQIEKVVMRFVGDSGDGIQLMGNQLSETSVIKSGNDIYTFVDFPPEIRAPAGSISGISGFQLSISSKKLYTIDDTIDLLIAFNPAALKTSIKNLKTEGMLIVDIDAFNDKNLKRAGYIDNPLNNIELKGLKVIKIPITKLTYEHVKDDVPSVSNAKRCKNFFVLGLVCWIYDRDINIIIEWIEKKFKVKEIINGNKKALLAGFNYGNTIELLKNQFIIPPLNKYDNTAKLIKISGSKAFSLGAITSTIIFKQPFFSANYPITPASDILHELSLYIDKDIKICQLEDEIAAINAIIGASYGGALALTCTSGPGLDLMQEGIGLAIMANLPILVINVQRSGPSTGIPTRSEQTDLLATIFGRHGESKVIVLAPSSPSDCFYTIIQGFYFSIKTLSPVIILSDANISNSSELWKIPSINEIKKKINIDLNDPDFNNNYKIWKTLGTKNNEYCTGGLERDELNGNVSYDPINHFNMVLKRHNKIKNIANSYEKTKIIENKKHDEYLIITWGSVYGMVRNVYENIVNENKINISLIVLRYLNPLPNDLKDIINSFKKILIVEENLGQLSFIIKSNYLIDIIQIYQVTGKPFIFNELKTQILRHCL